MWNEFLTAFSPFFDYFFAMVDKVFSIFLSPEGITLFDVPILLYPLGFMFLYAIVTTIFSSGAE